MLDIHHFSYGWLTPLLAYVMSFTGSLLGFQCALRARSGTGRPIWLAMAAAALGGAGIWVTYFIAMLGFSIEGTEVRYDGIVTALSALCPIVFAALGLFLAIRPRPTTALVVAGGGVIGLGIVAMHYAGMAAVRSSASISYEPLWVVLSALVALAAAIGSLWFAVHVRGVVRTVGAAAIMALATSGMHYLGVIGLAARAGSRSGPPEGSGAMQLLVPLIVGVSIVTMLMLIGVSLTSIERAVDLPPPRPVQVRPAADDFATGPLPIVRDGGAQAGRPAPGPAARPEPGTGAAERTPPAPGHRLPPMHRVPESFPAQAAPAGQTAAAPPAGQWPGAAPRPQDQPEQGRGRIGRVRPQPVAATQTSGTQYWPTTDDVRLRGKS
ncbi:MAG TPA: MHYT domain-containing protein [Nocardia sp.]|nr:MHYT domain-containing protein [Nocardia sp.]HLS76622.1 MHYT domain-containing protein [Nocardia sp.]